MADIICQVTNRDRADRVEFIWSAGGGFFDPYEVSGRRLPELRRTADQVRDRLERLVVALKQVRGKVEAIPEYLSYNLAKDGFRLFNEILPPDDPTAKDVRRWLRERQDPTGRHIVEVEIVVEEDPNQVEQFLAIPWNLVYDEDPEPYKILFKEGKNDSRWRPFWAIRYTLTSGRRVNPWRRDPDWTNLRVVAVIDPRVRASLSEEERANLEAFLKEFAFKPIDAAAPAGEADAQPLRFQVSSLDQLKAALKAGYPHLLLYWLSHAQPNYLLLGGERIDLRDLLSTCFAERDVPKGMLAFLNACRTAEPGDTDAFLDVLHSFGFIGAIATERQTINNFANRFGLKFLRGFLGDGTPVGRLLRELRLAEAPVGLLYGAHCPPEIHARVGAGASTQEASSAPSNDQATRRGVDDAQQVALAVPRHWAEPPPLPDHPYRSLAYYDSADRLLFTGRDADISRFAATLDRPDTRILILHGESGIGKSSFLRAGVVPYLEEDCAGYRFLRNTNGGVVIIQATKDPVGQLAVGLLEMTERSPEYRTPDRNARSIALRPVLDEASSGKADAATLRAALLADSSLLASLLERLSALLPHALVLVIDQAEELFTLAEKPEEIAARDQVLLLLQRVADVWADVKVIITLRTEYYGRLLDHLRAGRSDLAGVRDYLLRDFTKQALIEAIERPTSAAPLAEGQPSPRTKYGFTYHAGVAEQIADEVLQLRRENQDSVLPLVQVICTRLYDREVSDPASDRVVREDDLNAIGGVVGGLKAFAEDALVHAPLNLDPGDRDAFKAVYARLYTPQADGTLTTWLARRDELEKLWGGSRPFDEVLDAACEVRLLRKDNLWIEGETAQDYVRLGHDALAKVAAAWKEAARLAEERSQHLKRILRTVALSAAALLLIGAVSYGGYSLYYLKIINDSYYNEEVAMNQSDLGKAARIMNDVWNTRKRWLGENHPDTLRAAKNLSDVYFTQGKFDESEPLDHAVLDARLRSLGEDNDDTLTSMFDLTNSYSYQRKYQLTLPWYRKMVEVCRKRYNKNPKNPDKTDLVLLVRATNDLASVLQLTGSPNDAVAHLKELLATLEQGTDKGIDPATNGAGAIAYTEINFGWVLLHQHDVAGAETHIRKAQATMERNKADGWPSYAARGLLAGIALEKNGGDGSEKELLDSYDGLLSNTKEPIIPPLEMACLDDTASWLYEYYTKHHLPDKASKYRSPVKHRFPYGQFGQ